jgi:CRISPR-associated protein Cmr5
MPEENQEGSKHRHRMIEQERAQQAWRNVREAKENLTDQERYRSQAVGLHAMIQMNGLGQTLAFLKAKGKVDEEKGRRRDTETDQPINPDDPDAMLFWHLSDWVGKCLGCGQSGLLSWIAESASTEEYRRATVECLAFGLWLRRFAEAELRTSNRGTTRRGE